MSDLRARLEFQAQANAILLATTRPKEGRTGPLMTPAELEAMALAYTMGLSAAGFAARLMARDRKVTT